MAAETIAPSHLESDDVECPECEAKPGERCVTFAYGREMLHETHDARQEAADYHELNVREQDGHTVKTCPECGYVDVN